MTHTKIDWKEVKSIIYNHLDLPSAFTLALGFFHPQNRFKNPFRLDKKGDCTFFQDKADSRIWLFHDFAAGETYDIFRAYELSQGTEFIETIRALSELANCIPQLQELGLFLDSKPTLEESNISGSEFIKRLKEQKKKEKQEMQGIISAEYQKKKEELLLAQQSEEWSKPKPQYKYVAHEFGIFMPHHAAFWAKRGLTYAEVKDNVVALQQVYTEKADGSKHIVFTDSINQPLFLYIEQNNTHAASDSYNKWLEQVAQQIYRPYSGSKKHKFRNIGSPELLIYNCDDDDMSFYCHKQLVDGTTDHYPWEGVIVTKGYKEALLLQKLMKNYIIIGKCGEGAKLPQEFLEKNVDKFFPNEDFPIYIWQDNDAEGRKHADRQEAHYLNLGYTSVFKVFIADENTGHKDIDELVVAAIKSYPNDWEGSATIVLECRILEAINAIKDNI